MIMFCKINGTQSNQYTNSYVLLSKTEKSANVKVEALKNKSCIPPPENS